MISIITATYNAADLLPRLVQSLKAQTDTDFEWVVADGGSSDDTLKLLHEAKAELRDVKISSQPDFGIYDALNRAIRLSARDYYLVVGADDWLDENCIFNFKKAIKENDADIYTAILECENGGFIKRPRGKIWLYGMGGLITGHSIGSVYKKSLHEKFGFYSKKYPIAADCHFVMKAHHNGAKIQFCNFRSGVFGQKGVSSTDSIGSITELYRVQLDSGASIFYQTTLFIFRLIKIVLR